MRTRGGVMTCAVLALMATGGAARADEDPARDSRPVATVDGIPIAVADLDRYAASRPPASGAASEEAVRKRLEELVLTEALYREALRLGVERIPEVARTIRQVVVQRLVEDQVERPARERPITEEELRAYYDAHRTEYDRPEQVRLAEVFLAVPEGDLGARAQRRAKAEAVLGLAKGLRDLRFGFGELVLEHSDAPAGHPRGDTGLFDREGKPGGIEKALAEAGFEIAKVGQIHDGVIETAAGFHVVMLVARRAADHRRFEEVRGEIEQRIRREDRGRALNAYLEGVRRSAQVSIDEVALADLARRRVPPATDHAGGNEAPPALPAGAP